MNRESVFSAFRLDTDYPLTVNNWRWWKEHSFTDNGYR